MRLEKRIEQLEEIAERNNKDYETGAWIIFEHADGSRRLSSQRLGSHDFENEEQMQKFIDKHHKGTPESWGDVDFIIVSDADIQGEPPKEL